MLGARVEFHLANDGKPITFDVGHVFAHLPHEQGGTYIVSAMGYAYHVNESYTTVSEEIKKATARH